MLECELAHNESEMYAVSVIWQVFYEKHIP